MGANLPPPPFYMMLANKQQQFQYKLHGFQFLGQRCENCNIPQRGRFPRGRTVHYAKSRLCSTTGSHGSQGPEVCTPDAVLN